MKSQGKDILSSERFRLTLRRLAHQIIENYPDLSDVHIVGIQESGVHFSQRMVEELRQVSSAQTVHHGKLDISFFRDDYHLRTDPIEVKPTELPFDVEGKRILLLDDVLYTGRTVHAAMTALLHFGRPRSIELMVLVDRRFNRHFPIRPDYTGITVDALDNAYVRVEWAEESGVDRIRMFASDS